MKKSVMLLLLFFLFLPKTALAKEKVEIYYLYFNPCASCDSETEFINTFNEILKDHLNSEDYSLYFSNAFQDPDTYKKLCAERRIEPESENLPALFIKNDVYYGRTAIEANLLDSYVRNIENRQSSFPLIPAVASVGIICLCLIGGFALFRSKKSIKS